MDFNEMVLRCLATFQAGYGDGRKLMEINWLPWEQERTPEIQCVFTLVSPVYVRCRVHPTVSGTYGTEIYSGRTWELAD